jgi:DNA-directed RNA polymerase specialized sigma24 family protein
MAVGQNLVRDKLRARGTAEEREQEQPIGGTQQPKRRKRMKTTAVGAEGLAHLIDDNESPPHVAADQQFVRAALLRGLERLSPRRRQVLELMYFWGLGREEIAVEPSRSEQAPVSVNAVSTLLTHARHELATVVSEELDDRG